MILALLSLAERFVTGCAHFFTKAKTRLEWARIRHAIKEIRELTELAATFRASPEGGWTIAENDVLRLYQYVLHYRPHRILELGTGIGFSTAVMALALKKLGRGEITSLEQLPKCIETAATLIPQELKPFMRIIHAPPEVFRIEQLSKWIYFCGYRWQPHAGERFDFVLVDGPGGGVQDGSLVSLDAGDVIRLLPLLERGCKIYVDGRRATVKKLTRYFGRYLVLRERDSEYALFERTAEPLPSLRELVIVDAKRAPAGSRTPYADAASTDNE